MNVHFVIKVPPKVIRITDPEDMCIVAAEILMQDYETPDCMVSVY